MGKEISLFSGYDQKENRTTNYCLWVLREVYETSPRLFGTVLSELVGRDDLEVGVRFFQQERAGASIPDGRIQQQGFTLYLETKNHDWFHWPQIESHLDALLKEKSPNKLFLALSNFETESHLERIQQMAEEKCGGEVSFAVASFRDLLDALGSQREHPSLGPLLIEFERYLDESGLLENWETRLIVINCGKTLHEIEAGAYLCPARGGSYKLLRSKWFAPYSSKQSQQLRAIQGVVDVTLRSREELGPEESAALKAGQAIWKEEVFAWCYWKNSEEEIATCIDRAILIASRLRPHAMSDGIRVLLLGGSTPCSFRKDTSGGMFGTKRYFKVPKGTQEEIARYLDGKTWSDFRGGN